MSVPIGRLVHVSVTSASGDSNYVSNGSAVVSQDDLTVLCITAADAGGGSWAGVVELHETYRDDEGAPATRAVAALAVPCGATASAWLMARLTGPVSTVWRDSNGGFLNGRLTLTVL